MIDINEADFRRLDLNLLLAFSALLRERSVTRAAARLFIGQPAMSAALARLRAFAGDELFVRGANGMEPTAHALALAERLKPVLEGLSDALFASGGFDPATSERTFALGLFDIGEVTLAPPLLRELARQAPAVRLALRPVDRHDAVAQLESGAVDLALTDLGPHAGWICTQHLYREHFACMFDAQQVKVRTPISLKDYLAHPHLLTSFSGGFQGFVDEALAAQGLARRVTMTTTRFATLPFVLRSFAGIASLPGTAARELGAKLGLTVSPLPVEVPPVDLSLAWHARYDNDAGHRWFRELVAAVVTGLRGTAPATPGKRSGGKRDGKAPAGGRKRPPAAAR